MWRHGIVEEVVGMFEIAAAAGIEVEISLDVGDAGQGSSYEKTSVSLRT